MQVSASRLWVWGRSRSINSIRRKEEGLGLRQLNRHEASPSDSPDEPAGKP